MKKIRGVSVCLSLFAILLTGCGGSTAAIDVAQIVIAGGSINDGSFNQGAWDGITEYNKKSTDLVTKYYVSAEETTNSQIDSIQLAVKGGAKVIVLPGFNFETTTFQAQSMFPEVKFILLDGQPHDVDYNDFSIGDNVSPIFYAEQQAGFLAGYSLVKDGFRKLGFMGGMAYPAVIKFGYGMIYGAEIAAQELELEENAVEVRFTYVGNFAATPENQTLASSWYEAGTEVIFACGGSVGFSVMAAAEARSNKYVVGVDIDQAADSKTVITSAVKNLAGSVYDTLAMWEAGKFPGGEIRTLTVKENGVGLPMDTSKFRTFSQADYDLIYGRLVADENGMTTAIPTDETVESADKIDASHVKVLVIS